VNVLARIARTLLIGLSITGVSACHDAARQAATIRPSYDKATGRLKELAYDANRNGRPDTWTEMDGSKPLRSRVDLNEDGKIDRWEEYDEKGGLAKVGFSRTDNGKPDAWVFSGADGKVRRIEISHEPTVAYYGVQFFELDARLNDLVVDLTRPDRTPASLGDS